MDDPPPYAAAQRTPPRLDYTHALPGLDRVINATGGEMVPFQIPVTSEDAGDALSAILLLDWTGDALLGVEQLSSGNLPPSTLDDPSLRLFKLPWWVSKKIDPGCHRITLRVTHAANTGSPSTVIFDKTDLAEAYWFANVNVTPGNSGSVVSCPTGSSASDAP